MMNTTVKVCLFALAVLANGCAFAARSPEMYREDTAALLATRNAEISQCYTNILQSDQAAQGTVAIQFTVEAKTGSIMNAAIEPSGTTASDPVAQCVLAAIGSLTLDPPDQREGQAMYVWTFTATQSAPVAAPADGGAMVPPPPAG